MFWNNKKKNYRSQVKTLLLTMGIPDFDSIGILAIYDQIDIGYHNKFTEHETALTFAYSCIPKLAQQDMSGAIVFYEKTAKRQDEWLDSGLITQDVVGRFKELTLIHLDFKQNDNVEALSSEDRTKESDTDYKQSSSADDGGANQDSSDEDRVISQAVEIRRLAKAREKINALEHSLEQSEAKNRRLEREAEEKVIEAKNRRLEREAEEKVIEANMISNNTELFVNIKLKEFLLVCFDLYDNDIESLIGDKSCSEDKDDKACLSLMNSKLKKYLVTQGLYEFEIEEFVINGSKATWEIMADKIRIG